jgi:hypothetical protein
LEQLTASRDAVIRNPRISFGNFEFITRVFDFSFKV